MKEYAAMLEAIRTLLMTCSWVVAAWAATWLLAAAVVFYATWKMGRDK